MLLAQPAVSAIASYDREALAVAALWKRQSSAVSTAVRADLAVGLSPGGASGAPPSSRGPLALRSSGTSAAGAKTFSRDRCNLERAVGAFALCALGGPVWHQEYVFHPGHSAVAFPEPTRMIRAAGD